jgi:hypothetical protein
MFAKKNKKNEKMQLFVVNNTLGKRPGNSTTCMLELGDCNTTQQEVLLFVFLFQWESELKCNCSNTTPQH